MTRTIPTKVVSLSNTKSQNFKSELSNTKTQPGKTDVIKTSDGLFICSLKLPDGSSITIPMREDGYINATMLCKAGEKRLDNYMRSSKEFIEGLKNSFPQSEGMELITSKIGGNHTGTWVHRKIGYHLAQWLSPSFAIQVSNWLDELFITGKVELGQEKSNKELDNKLQEQIKQLTNENKELTHKYDKLRQIHNSLKFKRNYHQLEVGDCVYVCHNYHLKISIYYVK